MTKILLWPPEFPVKCGVFGVWWATREFNPLSPGVV